MKNKKGFTLVELLAVIAIIAIISLIAIPNIVGLSTGVRKDGMLDDAKKLISLAKYQVQKNATIRKTSPYTFSFDDLNTTNDLQLDPDGGEYDHAASYVIYSKENSTAKYCVYLKGSIRTVKDPESGGCVYEDNLYSRSNVVDN